MSSLAVRQSSVAHSSLAKPDVAPRAGVKHRGMIERKLERLFLESADLGWDYDNFVSSVLEILTVLHHRNKRRGEV
jgi:hypothetical protein